MTNLNYRYILERGFYRPKIPILISVGGHQTEVMGLIDSGSDFVLFPKDIAEAVGINLTGKEEEADGIGGRVKCKSGLATLTLRRGSITKRLRNMRIHVLMDDRSGIDEILLGRNNFFKHFKIEFNENAKHVKLIPTRSPLKTNR
ncbi:MAG: retropepsin-like domain-containing protein [Candidatus Aenigmarchaeota archaeon]|nr:retropepsin-like domain-containing protein [Candidatus Aenigmarchaeota archaeon]